jgi:pilus assembly protein CpaE
MSATASLSIDAGQEISREAFSAFVTDEETRHALAPIIQERGWSSNRIQAGGIANAVRSLALAPSPQYLIVDLSDSENPRADISALAEVCEPGTIVVALGTINDVSLYRDLLATGIHDYLIKPVTTEVLIDCLVTADNATRSMPAEEPVKAAGGRMIPVIGARGGVGASTVAVSIAWLTSHEFVRKVALLDLDIHYGTSTLAFDLEPGRGLCDALENPGRVDGLFIERAMVKESENLSILGAEASLTELLTPDPSALAHLVQELRSNFSNIIVDLPRHMASENTFLLSDAQEIYVVTDLSLPSMRDVIRLLGLCKDVAPNVPVKLICNKKTENDEVTKADFEKAVERSFDWQIPLDRKSLILSAKSGKPLPVAAKTSKPAGILRRIAKDIAGGADVRKKKSVWNKVFQGSKG